MNAGGISAKGRELAKQNREEFRKNRNKKNLKLKIFLMVIIDICHIPLQEIMMKILVIL